MQGRGAGSRPSVCVVGSTKWQGDDGRVESAKGSTGLRTALTATFSCRLATICTHHVVRLVSVAFSVLLVMVGHGGGCAIVNKRVVRLGAPSLFPVLQTSRLGIPRSDCAVQLS